MFIFVNHDLFTMFKYLCIRFGRYFIEKSIGLSIPLHPSVFLGIYLTLYILQLLIFNCSFFLDEFLDLFLHSTSRCGKVLSLLAKQEAHICLYKTPLCLMRFTLQTYSLIEVITWHASSCFCNLFAKILICHV